MIALVSLSLIIKAPFESKAPSKKGFEKRFFGSGFYWDVVPKSKDQLPLDTTLQNQKLVKE